MSKLITREVKEEIVAFYKSRPMTRYEVQEKFGYCLPTISKILNEYKVESYSKSKLFSPNLVEDYFQEIDTERKAYFLGLIITDGCVHYRPNKGEPMLAIELQDNDRYIIEELAKDLNTNKKITRDTRRSGCSNIQIISKQLVEDLSKYGVIPNKSLLTTFPKNLSLDMYPHMIRGILDGDGSIGFYQRKGRNVHVKTIRFCQGNEQFLLDLSQFLFDEVGIETKKLRQEKESLWSLPYASNESITKLYHYLYDNATIYFTRKKAAYDKVIQEIQYYHGNTEITSA